ncbi:MAG TPA: hypothetical protein VIL74_13880 [Pyrinomonadaceae bacterium]|jgi:hypothetical protein
MKIDASKNHPGERKESKNVFKAETSVFQTATPPKPPPASTGAFAKILEETRRDQERNDPSPVKNDAPEADSKTSETEKNKEMSRAADEPQESEERNSEGGDGDGAPNGDENYTPQTGLANLPPRAATSAETAPAARSILHVADLERIVSYIRTENFQNRKQVTIALKNSVLQGLQIRLTITENGKLKAEFLALDRQIKSKLEKRRKELSEILKNRSPLFSEIAISSHE